LRSEGGQGTGLAGLGGWPAGSWSERWRYTPTLPRSAIYTGEVFSNLSGGVRQKVEYLHNLDLTLAVDAEKLLGWPGTSFFVYGLWDWGGDPS
jgi:carbohydrate-selective porin OprB